MKQDRGKPDKLAMPLAVVRLLQQTGKLLEAAESVRSVRDDILATLRQTPVTLDESEARHA